MKDGEKTTSRRSTPYSSTGGELGTLEYANTNHLHQARAKPWRSLGVVLSPLCGDGRRRITTN